MLVTGDWHPLDLCQDYRVFTHNYLQGYGKVSTFAVSEWLKTMTRR